MSSRAVAPRWAFRNWFSRTVPCVALFDFRHVLDIASYSAIIRIPDVQWPPGRAKRVALVGRESWVREGGGGRSEFAGPNVVRVAGRHPIGMF